MARQWLLAFGYWAGSHELAAADELVRLFVLCLDKICSAVSLHAYLVLACTTQPRPVVHAVKTHCEATDGCRQRYQICGSSVVVASSAVFVTRPPIYLHSCQRLGY